MTGLLVSTGFPTLRQDRFLDEVVKRLLAVESASVKCLVSERYQCCVSPRSLPQCGFLPLARLSRALSLYCEPVPLPHVDSH